LFPGIPFARPPYNAAAWHNFPPSPKRADGELVPGNHGGRSCIAGPCDPADLSFRTAEERTALKAMRGDFNGLRKQPLRALEAARA
jgi:hypothetical protein